MPITLKVNSMTQQETRGRTRSLNRREWLTGASLAAGAAFCSQMPSWLPAAPVTGKKTRVAAIFTEFTYRSHAHVILENFLKPYIFRGELVTPPVEVVSFWGDQFPDHDMAKQVSEEFNIPLVDSIHEAMTLGGDRLACDAVLSIGEFGQYPHNSLGQQMYPRKQFFDQIIQSMQSCETFVPVFNDKHFSYRWDWSKEMYDTTRQLQIPFMAGSSVPLAHRKPQLELPEDCEFDELLLIHGGGPDSYDFHALETLQSLIEFRRGGETGASHVQCLQGEAVWKAAEDKLWNPELVEAALRPELGDEAKNWKAMLKSPYLMLVYYKDGLVAPLFSVTGNRWAFACRLKGEADVQACQFHVGPWRNRNLFKALARAIQHFFVTKQAPYPIERTLLTTGITEANMQSRHNNGEKVPTPQLEFSYQPHDFVEFREDGTSWDILTYDVPQPEGIQPLGGLNRGG